MRGLILRELVSSPLRHMLRLGLDVSYIRAESARPLHGMVLRLGSLGELRALVVALIAGGKLRRLALELHFRFRLLRRAGHLRRAFAALCIVLQSDDGIALRVAADRHAELLHLGGLLAPRR